MTLLRYLLRWQPFKIDALGIVTLLGAPEMDQALGRLVRYRYAEFLPLLGAFVIAGNDIVKPVLGFRLYNVTDGIEATDIAAWFGRWVNSQEFTWNSSYLHISRAQRHRQRSYTVENLHSAILGVIIMGTVIVINILIWDWWGFANTISMVISVISKNIILRENKEGLNMAYKKIATEEWASQYQKTLLLTARGQAIVIYTPRGIITEVLLTNPKPPHPRLYSFAQVLGWVGFVCHVISLGMTSLINQLITVALLLTATVLVAYRIGCDEFHIGSEIQIDQFDEKEGRDSRSRVYLRMDLSQNEESSMLAWGLVPRRSNRGWWKRYRTGIADPDRTAFDLWKGRFWCDGTTGQVHEMVSPLPNNSSSLHDTVKV